MLKQPNFFHSQPSTLPTEAPAKFYLSTTVGLSSMISSVAPTGSSTFYAYLITKIGNRNLNNSSVVDGLYAEFPSRLSLVRSCLCVRCSLFCLILSVILRSLH